MDFSAVNSDVVPGFQSLLQVGSRGFISVEVVSQKASGPAFIVGDFAAVYGYRATSVNTDPTYFAVGFRMISGYSVTYFAAIHFELCAFSYRDICRPGLCA